MQFFDCFCKTGTHFSGRFPLFKRNPGCSEDFFQLIQSVCITERCVREGEPPQITRDAAKPRAPIKNAGVTL